MKVCAAHVASRNGRQPGARDVVPATPRGIRRQAVETLNTPILTNTITQQLPVRCNRTVCPESVCGTQAIRKKRRVVVA